MRGQFVGAALSACLVVAIGATIPTVARAATDAVHPHEREWPMNGVFGSFDRPAVQRGFQVYKEVCHACHGAKYLAFRNLTTLGYSEDEVRAIAAEFEVQDGPNDEGEMFTRPARPSDKMPSPYPNDAASRAANNGALPPDLSLIIEAREGGADYLHSLLIGYSDPPPDVTVPDGLYYNPYFPGRMIAMPAPLSEDQVTYADGTKATVDQMSSDVSQFLAFVAEPNMEERKTMGLKAMLFLVTLAGMLYAYKRKIWSDVH